LDVEFAVDYLLGDAGFGAFGIEGGLGVDYYFLNLQDGWDAHGQGDYPDGKDCAVVPNRGSCKGSEEQVLTSFRVSLNPCLGGDKAVV